MTIPALVNLFSSVIINPILALLFGAGLLVFLYGMVEFFFEVGVRGNQSAKEDGKRHMLYGVLGMFIMVASWGIIQVIASTVGVQLWSGNH